MQTKANNDLVVTVVRAALVVWLLVSLLRLIFRGC
jgi:uncharacterized membrane protein